MAIVNEKQKIQIRKTIDMLDQYECAKMYRFSCKDQNPIFDSRNGLFEYFMKKFSSVGGMTSSISKSIGW